MEPDTSATTNKPENVPLQQSLTLPMDSVATPRRLGRCFAFLYRGPNPRILIGPDCTQSHTHSAF